MKESYRLLIGGIRNDPRDLERRKRPNLKAGFQREHNRH
jgi:hypothetical protein